MIKITFPDGSVREYEAGVTGLQIAESISSRLAQDVLACGVNGEIVDDLYTQTAIEGGNTPIAFSPSFIGNSLITLGSNGLEIALQSQYVSRQYLDNFGTKENSLDAYFVNHLSASYSFKTRHTKRITIGATVYNLFNTKYETNGYSQSVALYENGDKTKAYAIKHDPRFYPMAGTNILAHLTLRF